MTDYILYDERGVFDPDEASILEAFQAKDDASAFAEAVRSWSEHAWALYDGSKGDDGLIAWSSPKKKSVVRWFYLWAEPRQYKYKTGKEQKLDEGKAQATL